jgi:hypothetical protein
MMRPISRLLVSACFFALPTGVAAQSPAPAALEPPTAPVAVLPTALYNDQANVREASDSTQAQLGQSALRSRLDSILGEQLRSFGLTDSIARSPQLATLAGGVGCEVRVACGLAVGRAAEARWIVLSKISKTSNLIWLLSAQLIHVPDGAIILDDSTELKGDPGPMVRVGMRQFADRVVRTIRAGGVATNFPPPGPSSP